jgi:hypothetical protein
MIRNAGFNALAATAIPEIKPPPPIGTTSVSRYGMNHDQAVRLAILAGELAGFLQGRAGNDDLGTEPARVLDLHHRRPDRHHDSGGNAEPPCVVGDALRMIARRHRDDAAPPFLRRQRRKPIEGTALLEGRGELEILEFEPDPAAENRTKRPALVAFGKENRPADGRCRRLDVSQGNRKACDRKAVGVEGGLLCFRHQRSHRYWRVNSLRR